MFVIVVFVRHHLQAMCRSYRFGQTKPTYVYRLVAAGTLERKILNMQVKKEGLSRRIVDDVKNSLFVSEYVTLRVAVTLRFCNVIVVCNRRGE